MRKMPSFWKKKRNSQFDWKVCLFFSSVLAFIFGYICGTAVPYLDGSLLKSTNAYPVSEAALHNHKPSYFLAIAILSSVHNFDRRQVIRSTWLSLLRSDVQHKFVIGTKGLTSSEMADLQKELSRYEDLLLLDHVEDSYSHLSTKILQYFSWLHKSVNCTFVLKCDDDSFVRLDIVYMELMSLQQKTRIYMGFFDGRAHVFKKGRWSEKNWILCDRYLPYAQGGGYILSYDVASYIAQNSNLLTMFNSEDVTVGVWTAALKITRIHDPRFDTEFESRGCSNKYLITHKQSPEEMQKKYETLSKKGVLCVQEFQKKKSYIYNWSVTPSMCCIRNNSKVP